METLSPLAVANTIKDQIGRQALLMLGATCFVGDAKSLRFRIKGSKVGQLIIITLDPSDTYTVEVVKIRGLDYKVAASREGVYFDGLNQTIEALTGLYTSL